MQNTRYKKFPVSETATRFFLRSATASRHVRVKMQGIALVLILCSFLEIVYSATSIIPFRDLNNRSSEQNALYEKYVWSLLKKLQSWERSKGTYIERKQLFARKDKINKRLQEKLLKSHFTDTSMV